MEMADRLPDDTMREIYVKLRDCNKNSSELDLLVARFKTPLNQFLSLAYQQRLFKLITNYRQESAPLTAVTLKLFSNLYFHDEGHA